MSFFGVILDAEVARLNMQLRHCLSNKTQTKMQSCLRMLKKVFHQSDMNKNGKLEQEQFVKALNKLGLFIKRWQQQAYFQYFDTNKDGLVSWQQFYNGINNLICKRIPLNQKRRKAIEEVFSKIQENGVIELSRISQKVNLFPMQLYLDGNKKINLIDLLGIYKKAFEVEGDQVTFEQFLKYYEDLSVRYIEDQAFIKMIQNMYQTRTTKQQIVDKQMLRAAVKELRYKFIQNTKYVDDQFILKKLFLQFDSENKEQQTIIRRLSIQDLQALCLKFHVPLRRCVLQAIMKKFDINENGFLQFDELKNFLILNEYP